MNKILLVNFNDKDIESRRIRLNGDDMIVSEDDITGMLKHHLPHEISSSIAKIEYYDKAMGKYINYDELSQQIIDAKVMTVLITLWNNSSNDDIMLIKGREFDADKHLLIDNHQIILNEVDQAVLGTGFMTWDGSVILSKYLESYPYLVKDKTIIELGAGTGFAGIAAGILGAKQVLLTDLSYAISNLQANVDRNRSCFAERDGVSVSMLDWADASSYPLASTSWDVIIGADVVWLEHLIPALVQACDYLCGPSSIIFLAHQTRSLATDRSLFHQLEANFHIESIGRDFYPIEYVDSKITIYKLHRLSS